MHAQRPRAVNEAAVAIEAAFLALSRGPVNNKEWHDGHGFLLEITNVSTGMQFGCPIFEAYVCLMKSSAHAEVRNFAATQLRRRIAAARTHDAVEFCRDNLRDFFGVTEEAVRTQLEMGIATLARLRQRLRK
eukprot:Polyplicarium_translucidae@DN4851_c0_g1_i1.p2